jgi:DNA-binding CsgD family transcriptional regulator
MTESNTLSPRDALVSKLYSAAARQESWSEALRPMLDLFGAWGVQLLGLHPQDRSIVFSHEVGGFNADAALEYIRRYHRIDPRLEIVLGMQVGEWFDCHEHFDEDLVAGHPFFQEFLLPAGGRYVSGTIVHRDDGLTVFLAIHRGRGTTPLSAGEVQTARQIAGHLTVAIGLWRRDPASHRPASPGHALLDRLPQPMMLIDEHLRLHHQNRAAAALLTSGRGLAERAGTLVVTAPGHESDLVLAMRRLQLRQDDPPADGRDRVDSIVLRIESPDAAEPLVAVALALHPEETMGVFGHRDLAMVLVHDVGRHAPPDPLVLEVAFGLTPAEARVAARIAAGSTVEAIALGNGVSTATVRTQLSQVFAKVGVRRQHELAARLMALPAPQRG